MEAAKKENNKISLAEFISQNYELFCTEDGSVIAIMGDGRNLAINNSKFKRRCAKDYLDATGEYPSNKEMNQALSDVGLKALAEAPVIEVVDGNHVRQESRHIFRQEDGNQLVVSAKGSEIVARTDTCLHFSKGSGRGYVIPTPSKKPLIEILGKYLNLASDQVLLFVCCLIKAFMPGPDPVMLFIGPQGSGKTLAAKIFKMIVDPDDDDTRVRILDNLSAIGSKLSDDFCRASHQFLQIITTICQLMPNQDLGDRAIVFDFKAIPDNDRIPETKLLARLNNDMPPIMFWLYSGVSSALKQYQDVELLSYPRLADFVQANVAACPGLDMKVEDFISAMDRNRVELVERSLNQNPVSAAVLDFMDKLEENSWSGTGTELLELLTNKVDDDIKSHSNWPSKPNKLSAMLNRAAPFLKTRGLDIQWAKSGQRSITLVKLQAENDEQPSVQTSMADFMERQDNDEKAPFWAGSETEAKVESFSNAENEEVPA